VALILDITRSAKRACPGCPWYNGVHLTKLLYGKFVVAGAKLDEVDEMWVLNIGCSNAWGRLPVAAISAVNQRQTKHDRCT
jgi:hypothetical protein